MTTQHPPKRKPLTVYKASAGSGKTFTLAVEYIKQLIENPLFYRNILAVTFTNKATEEMKMRILSQLNGLAHGYDDSKDYLEKITKELGCDEQQVRKNAMVALTSIIHDYSAFRVETIDKFFQRVLRNLARELDLTANLRIELNDKQVEQLAVDTMIESLNEKDDVMEWLMIYILESIGEDKGWNIISKVKTFGENIFKDAYKAKRKKLQEFMTDPEYFEKVRTQLNQTKKACEDKIPDIATPFFEATKGYGINDFYQGQKGVYGFFDKLRSGILPTSVGSYVLKCTESAESWARKTSPKYAAIVALAENQLMEILNNAIKEVERRTRLAKTVTVTHKNLNQLRLLGTIEDKVHKLNTDSNRFLLSDTQGLLNSLINGSDSPFIFEKIGAPLRSIMIDEFQDTSALQWNNFKVLLNECMSHGTNNLIVGDVKQSIYRWRNGDWRLLNGIKKEFHNDDSLLEVLPLDTNYRSCRKVIDFNNQFFILAAKKEQERLQKMVGDEAMELGTAYADVRQNVPKDKADTGYIRIEMMDADTEEDTIMEHLADTIRKLIDNGTPQNKITILARNKKEIESTAHYFQNNVPEVYIISDEAFILGSSIAVTIIVDAMRLMANEKDELCAATLAKAYQNGIMEANDCDYMLIDDGKDKDEGNGQQLPFAHLLPEGFRNADDLAHLRCLPLTDLTEALYNIFELRKLKGQSAYICTFYDKLADYLKDNPSDIDRFLDTWDENLCNEKIHGDQVNGVRMMTIHKSKGLESDNIIIPFGSWALEKAGNVIWCETDVQPFKLLPVLPINYSKSQMVGTLYEKDYDHEHLQNSVDNLNLLYVAFTRAKRRLFVMGKVKKKAKEEKKESKSSPSLRSELICDCLPELSKLLEGSVLETGENGEMTFEYGQCFEEVEKKKEKEESKNVFLLPEQGCSIAITSYPSRAKFRQSNSSRAFTTTEESELLRAEYISRGNLLHAIFSRLRDISDIDRVLQQLTNEGILYDEVPEEELRQLLSRALSNTKVRKWFSPHWKLHNECTILYKDPKTGSTKECRPDRVMTDGKKTIVVDYKFGKPNDEHEKQVKAYIKQLVDMGYQEVEGYLWYVSRNRVVPVN